MTVGSIPKVAVVTGAAHRLGMAMALALAEDGYAVALHYSQSGQAADDEGSMVATSKAAV